MCAEDYTEMSVPCLSCVDVLKRNIVQCCDVVTYFWKENHLLAKEISKNPENVLVAFSFLKTIALKIKIHGLRQIWKLKFCGF